MRDSASLPALLQSFFTIRLMTQRGASPHTIASYRDTFRLLLQFAQKRLRKAPSQLELNDLDAALIGAFLARGSGKRSTQRRQEPQSAFDGHPLLLPVCLARGACAERSHPTGVGDS